MSTTPSRPEEVPSLFPRVEDEESPVLVDGAGIEVDPIGENGSHSAALFLKSDGYNDDATVNSILHNAAGQGQKAEDSRVLMDKVMKSANDHLGRNLLSKEKDSGSLENRAKQAILHLTFTELRITDLESKLRKLEKDIHKLPDNFKPAKKKLPVHRHVLKRSTFDEFRLTSRSLNMLLKINQHWRCWSASNSNNLGLSQTSVYHRRSDIRDWKGLQGLFTRFPRRSESDLAR
jgi:hypothetical protein